MDSMRRTAEEEARYQAHITALSARSGRIVLQVAKRVCAAVNSTVDVTNKEWAWQLTLHGRGSCYLRRDSEWFQVCPVGGNDTLEIFDKDAFDEHIIQTMVRAMTQFPITHSLSHQSETMNSSGGSSYTTAFEPMDSSKEQQAAKIRADFENTMQQKKKKKNPAGAVRKTEAQRLLADAAVYKKYKDC